MLYSRTYPSLTTEHGNKLNQGHAKGLWKILVSHSVYSKLGALTGVRALTYIPVKRCSLVINRECCILSHKNCIDLKNFGDSYGSKHQAVPDFS